MATVDPLPFLVVDIVMWLSTRLLPLVYLRVVDAVLLRIPRAMIPRLFLFAVTVTTVTSRPRFAVILGLARIANRKAARG